jgi:ferric-dicitrate binding protein FerR (iron transport regulator)
MCVSASRRWLPTAVALAALLLAGVAEGQVARATATAGVVSKQAAGSASWTACRIGTTFGAGDRLRTAERSRAQLTFADGSIVRVGERSDLTVRAGVDAVRLQTGSLYGKFAKGAGATIGGRSAVAAVKGTVIEFIIEKDGTEVIRCHAGEVEVSRAP